MPPHSPCQLQSIMTSSFDRLSTEGPRTLLISLGSFRDRDIAGPKNSTPEKLIDIKTSKITHVDYISEDIVSQSLLTDRILLFGYATNYSKWVTKHLCRDAYSLEATVVQFSPLLWIKNNFFYLMFTFSHFPFLIVYSMFKSFCDYNKKDMCVYVFVCNY